MTTVSTPAPKAGETGARYGADRLRECLAGVRAALPIVLGYIPIGLAFGVGAAEKGLGALEVGVMSLFVFAGASQFIAVNMLAAGAAAWAIISTTFLVNLRHLLMSAALGPHVRSWPARLLIPAAFWLTDECFAVLSTGLATARLASPLKPAYVLSLEATAYLSWAASTVLGTALRHLVADGRAWGIDLTLPAMFAGLLALQLRQVPARRAAVVAAVTTLFLVRLGFGRWATLLAALAGAVWVGMRLGDGDRSA
ncbi:MAG: AzlC family ABC transporter permease [Limnochordales bacterium]|nr:AzlC family ABC transporter permease [Limnochordales bacterium]